MNTWVCRSIGVLLACFVFVSGAQAAAYNFRLVADTSGQFESFAPPAINASGTVLFKAGLANELVGLYTRNGGPFNKIADSSDSGPIFRFSNSAPHINAAGTVVFYAVLNSSSPRFAILTGNGGPLTTVIDDTYDFGGVRGPTFSSPTINDNGIVAFGAGYPTSTGSVSGLYTITGGTVTTIADDTVDPNILFYGRPAIDANGTVAFYAGIGLNEQAVFAGAGGPLTTVADSSGPFDSFGLLGMNAAGAIAFPGELDTGGQGLFVSEDGAITTIVDPDDAVFTSLGSPSINAGGDVVFWGRLASGDAGIFLGDDPVADKVILDSELLGGQIIDRVSIISNQGINDDGDIAFKALFADGSQGLYVATLIPVPPAIWLFGSALGLLGWMKRKTI